MILITGATGLVGRQLVARLAEREDLVCLVRPARRVRQVAPGVSVRVVSGGGGRAAPHSAYPYLKGKGQAEELIRTSGLDYTIVRASAVYGEDDKWTMPMAMGMHALPFVFPLPGEGQSRLQPLCGHDIGR